MRSRLLRGMLLAIAGCACLAVPATASAAIQTASGVATSVTETSAVSVPQSDGSYTGCGLWSIAMTTWGKGRTQNKSPNQPTGPALQLYVAIPVDVNTGKPDDPQAEALVAKLAHSSASETFQGYQKVVPVTVTYDDSPEPTCMGSPATNVVTGVSYSKPPIFPPFTIIDPGTTIGPFGHGNAGFFPEALGNETSFQCALVKLGTRRAAPRYRRCGGRQRPHTLGVLVEYHHLAPGRYIFYARAVGPGGVDPAPVTYRFRIR